VKLSTGAANALHSLGFYDKFSGMSDDRIESAVQRIEAALTRIADIADAEKPVGNGLSAEAPASVTALIEKHEALRETVSDTLAELDAVIGEIEQ